MKKKGCFLFIREKRRVTHQLTRKRAVALLFLWDAEKEMIILCSSAFQQLSLMTYS
jgi:hypothetical protein